MVARQSLAIDGSKPAITEPLRRFNTITRREAQTAYEVIMQGPLSGYLGGELHGGYHVEKLEAKFCEMLNVKHAVACNSATSGILIALMATGENKKSPIRTTSYTMSGTVAPAAVLGNGIRFGEIDSKTFCLLPEKGWFTLTVNLFGHPSKLHPGSFVIEDAAQSFLAMRDNKYITGDIAVFSGNVHKHVHCGEGGICCTNTEYFAHGMRLARNHGELAGKAPGLNLRLTEMQAAIWYQQLLRADKIISERRDIAEALSTFAIETGLGNPPIVEKGCTHSYYIWALTCASNRDGIVKALNAEGFPCKAGYVTPLYRLPAFEKKGLAIPSVESAEKSLVIYENCAWTPGTQQLKQIRQAFQKVANENVGSLEK